jgi:hypothetical protein
MRAAAVRACLREVSRLVGAALEPHHFDPSPALIVGDLLTRRWRRSVGWRTDAVDIAHQRVRPARLRVELRVLLPCPEGGETWLDGTSPASVLGSSPAYRLAPVLGLLPGHGTRLARTVAADITAALVWFERYDTPAEALALLRTGTTSWGRARTSATRCLATYLESVNPAGVEELEP